MILAHASNDGNEPVFLGIREFKGGENQRLKKRGMGGKQGLEKGKVAWGDQNGNIYAASDKAFGEIKERNYVT